MPVQRHFYRHYKKRLILIFNILFQYSEPETGRKKEEKKKEPEKGKKDKEGEIEEDEVGFRQDYSFVVLQIFCNIVKMSGAPRRSDQKKNHERIARQCVLECEIVYLNIVKKNKSFEYKVIFWLYKMFKYIKHFISIYIIILLDILQYFLITWNTKIILPSKNDNKEIYK